MLSRGGTPFAFRPAGGFSRRPALLRAVAVLTVAVLCGCGGGGASSNAPVPPTPLPTGTPAPTPPPVAQTTVTFSILVPPPAATGSTRRRPLYVSSATQSARITINNGAPVVLNMVAGSPGCTTTAQGTQCAVSVAAPVGTDTLSVALYGQVNAAGPILSQGTASANVVMGAANTIALTLSGVVAKVVLVLGNSAPMRGVATTIPLTVTLQDASGATIVGDPFANPISLTDSDNSGATSISRASLTSPADAVGLTVTYSGAAIGPATFGATASGLSPSSVSPATLTPASPTPSPSPSPSPTPSPTPTPTPTPTPSPTPPSTSFVDWTTYGFDNHRDGFNPSSGAFTPGSLFGLHLSWQQSYGDNATQSQPVLATNIGSHAGVVFVGGQLGIVSAFDAQTGSRMWQRSLGQVQYSCSGGAQSQTGIGGSVAYDPGSRTIFVSSNQNSGPNAPSVNSIVRLDAASGAQLGSIPFATSPLTGELNIAHTSIALANGLVYAGTGSTCDISSWRGRVAAVNANLTGGPLTFYTVYGQGGNFSGGGVWSWGGVAVDDGGAVYAGVGNADTGQGSGGPQPPFQQTTNEQAGYGDHVVRLASDLSNVLGTNYPGGGVGSTDDLDFTGTPVLFKPIGCSDTLLAEQGKAGDLVVYDSLNLGGGPIGRFRLAPTDGTPTDLSNPAWSPATGLLYVNVISTLGGTIDPPGLVALRPSGCNGGTTFSMAWHTAFGPDSFTGTNPRPRSAPTVTAGGVVFVGTPCSSDGNGGCLASIGATFGGALWALDASSGALLNNGKPVLLTSAVIRAPATVDGAWVYVQDTFANLYGLTIDPHFVTIAGRHRPVVPRDTWFPNPHRYRNRQL